MTACSIEKQCSGCRKIYPATTEYFNKRKSSKDGLRNVCRECRKNYMQKYSKMPERIIALKKYRSRPEIRKKAVQSQKEYKQTPKGRAAQKRYREKCRENGKQRESHLKRNYDITLEDYNRMFKAQNGVCLVCSKKETHKNQYGIMQLSVDHNHKTGKIRGLLCNNCNRGMGLLKNNLQKAVKYLSRFEV